MKKIKSIEIGKQDSPDKAFLVNTLLHEYFEAEILKNQYTKKYYNKLHKASDTVRHKWISNKIAKTIQDVKTKVMGRRGTAFALVIEHITKSATLNVRKG